MREEVIRGGIENGNWMSCARFCELTGLDVARAEQYAEDGKIARNGEQYSYDSYMAYLGVMPKKRKGQRHERR